MIVCVCFLKQKCIRLAHEKLTVFPYGHYINGIAIKCGFKMYFLTRLKLASTRNLLKCNSGFRKKSRVAAASQKVG